MAEPDLAWVALPLLLPHRMHTGCPDNPGDPLCLPRCLGPRLYCQPVQNYWTKRQTTDGSRRDRLYPHGDLDRDRLVAILSQRKDQRL